MWKHEIVDFLESATPQKEIEHWKWLAQCVKASQTFYFGEAEQLDQTIEKRKGEKYDAYINTPFQCTLYEWSESRKIGVDSQKSVWSPKRAVLVLTLSNKTQVSFGFYYTSESVYGDRWNVSLANSVATPDDDDVKWNNWAGVDWTEFGGQAACDTIILETGQDFAMARLYNDILNCQNVVIKDVLPPEKLNRKRIRKGKLPLYSYKILEVVKGKPKTKNAGSVPWDYKSPEAVRFHLCRGHFKTFTDERPLFGKYSGTFWWNPQSRGDRSKGVVEKDYRVKTEGDLAI